MISMKMIKEFLDWIKMINEDKVEELTKELIFMYKKYQDLCLSYKNLAIKINNRTATSSRDQSHMLYKNNSIVSNDIIENKEETWQKKVQ